jgi:hypothetical protein
LPVQFVIVYVLIVTKVPLNDFLSQIPFVPLWFILLCLRCTAKSWPALNSDGAIKWPGSLAGDWPDGWKNAYKTFVQGGALLDPLSGFVPHNFLF